MFKRVLSARNAFQRQTLCPRLSTSIKSNRTTNRTFFSLRNAVAKGTSAPPLLSRYPLLADTAWYLKWATGFLLVSHIFVDYFYALHATWGISMVPSLAPSGDCVLISKYYRRGRDIKVGDLVSFKHPLREDIRATKRVVGMPGDFVLRDSPGKNDMMIQVPEGHCYVVGDNLNHSRDSRMFGPLPLALVRGKVVAVIRGWSLMGVPGGLLDPLEDDE